MNKTGNRQLKKFQAPKSKFQILLFVIWNLLCYLSIVTLSGCGAKHPTLSDTHLSAAKFNQKAESAFKDKDFENALRLYNEALKINRSIENLDGIAINIINMAATYRKLGDKNNAHKQIDEILNTSPIVYNPIHLSEAAFLKTMLYMDENNYDNALEWTDRALTFCQSSQCSDIGKIYNLKGRIYLEKGDTASAITYGNKGLESNKEDGHKTEMANSLRLIADAKLMKGEYEGARKFYEDALSIDKKLEAGKKIAMDLMGIGNTFFKQKMCGDAVRYYQRALSVSSGLGDGEGAKEAAEMINKCYGCSN